MKKISLVFLILFVANSVFASSSSEPEKPLEGSYPIVLIHGILGFDDTSGLLNGLVKYWGGMDGYLRNQGVAVLTPGSQAMAHTIYRAEATEYLVNQWIAANGYSKVHLLGHSQGGLVARWMASNLAIKSKISTVTTLNSVHRGAPVADIVLGLVPDWAKPFVAIVVNSISGLIYGSEQDLLQMGESLTYSYMNGTFNNLAQNNPAIKYFSYASKMAWADPVQHPVMGLLYPATWAGGLFYGQGGDNDGIVPLSSQKWGTYKGGPSYSWWVTGVDHLQATNLEWWGENFYDVEAYFLKMAQNAKANQ